MAANNSNEGVLYDFFPFLRQYNDGRIERLMGEEFVPPSLDPLTGVQSKDVDISPQNNVSARLYLPKNNVVDDSDKKLIPLLVYFHGGGFFVESAFSPLYHPHLNSLVAEANVVAVSVNYRLAPEHPLPVAYEDCLLALKWVVDQFNDDEGGEEWLRSYVDLNRVYLGGDSAGGNIAHNMGVWVGARPELINGLKIRGIYYNCPFFHGEDPIGDEESSKVIPKSFLDRLWPYVCPSTQGCDDPWLNPRMDPNLPSLGCKRVLLYVAEKDSLRGWGWHYKEVLLKSGWSGDIEVVEVKGEDHVFNLFSPTSENAMAMLKKVALFLNQ